MKNLINLPVAIVLAIGTTYPIRAQSPQNPSPMVEHIREHPRLEKQDLPGQRVPLSVGTLYLPKLEREQARPDDPASDRQAPAQIPLVVTFHCGDWIPEVAVSRLSNPLPCLRVQLGSGSSRYSKPFAEDLGLMDRLVEEASQHLKANISEVILVGWSAGYGAIGQILSLHNSKFKVSSVMLIDGLHTGYANEKPGPEESSLQTGTLEPFLSYAKQAVQGDRRMIIVHSEIFPGTYASTTETADWLLNQLNLQRTAVLRWGPMKTQILGESKEGKLIVRAFAGNSAPDHVDLLHSLPELLDELLSL